MLAPRPGRHPRALVMLLEPAPLIAAARTLADQGELAVRAPAMPPQIFSQDCAAPWYNKGPGIKISDKLDLLSFTPAAMDKV